MMEGKIRMKNSVCKENKLKDRKKRVEVVVS